ncbi:hypothetical protein MGP2080_14946 [marine gamma proteobacterium HTCC2080]|nr:hypothetical protein MGP2080_14946 [marine gamma proteobacterium HTCC2080]
MRPLVRVGAFFASFKNGADKRFQGIFSSNISFEMQNVSLNVSLKTGEARERPRGARAFFRTQHGIKLLA